VSRVLVGGFQKKYILFGQKYIVHLIYFNQRNFLNWRYQFSHPFILLPYSPRRGKGKPADPVGQGCENDRTKPRLQGGASELENVTITTALLIRGSSLNKRK